MNQTSRVELAPLSSLVPFRKERSKNHHMKIIHIEPTFMKRWGPLSLLFPFRPKNEKHQGLWQLFGRWCFSTIATMGICLDTFRNRGCDSELDNRKDFCVLVCVKDGEWLMVQHQDMDICIFAHMHANV